MKMMRTIGVVTILALLVCSVQVAQAHRARVFALVENGFLVVESAFSGGKAAQGVKISVLDAATKEELFTGTTDTEGKARLPLPDRVKAASKGLTIVLDGGEGHRAEWTVLPEEYGAMATAQDPVSDTYSDTSASAPTEAASVDAVNTAQLRDLIRTEVAAALDTKLAPVKMELAHALDPEPSLKDIAGGLGWIVGLAGLAAWGASRRRS